MTMTHTRTHGVRINRWLDFLDRVGWTAVYTIAAALFTVLTTAGYGWEGGLKFIGIATALAVVKVTIAQRRGDDALGSAVPGKVIETGEQPRRRRTRRHR